MKWILTFFCCLSSLFLSIGASRAAGLPHGNFSELKSTGTARVEALIDPETVQLANKTVIHLAGLEYPDFKSGEPGEFSLTALKILKDMLEGKTVNIYQTKKDDTGRVNRMGHQIAQLERQSGEIWVEGTMIALGLAVPRTSAANPEMSTQMYLLEQKALLEKAGLWGKNEFRILKPEETAQEEDAFHIVQGKIQNVSIKNNRIYMNFGSDWRSDFTVSIAPENKRAFSKLGIDLLKLNGKTVRVRGWIQDYNGPLIEIDHPQAIEVIEG